MSFPESEPKPENNEELESLLTETFGPPPVADIDAWRKRYPSALAWLNPQRISVLSQRKKRMQRITIMATTAAAAICVWFGLSHFNTNSTGASAFAQTVEQIQKAKTITWKTVYYEHITSKNKKNTWLHTGVIENAYKAPGLRRKVWLDEKGQVKSIEITDSIRGRQITYCPKEKKATLKEFAPCDNPPGPFDYFPKELNELNLQWVGKRKTPTGEVNVFRHTYQYYVGRERNWSDDFWIDAKTKQLVASYNPGADIYDPENDPLSKNQPGSPGDQSGRTIIRNGEMDIVYDVELDDSLFDLKPPEGYAVEVKKRDRVTEKEMIDYWGIVADFNDKTFPDKADNSWSLLDKIELAIHKPKNKQTAAERKLLDTDMRYSWRFSTATNAPIVVFFSWDPDSVIKNSFRYLGKGVKLGDKDRIVCWYKLKDAKDPGTYRVIYGDLSVKDVAAKDLPLPVEP